MRRDRRGRRRVAGQERGLRPLHPALPPAWLSRAIRISMPMTHWVEFDALVSRAASEAPTAARAVGHVVATLLHPSRRRPTEPHWLDFEREKALRLKLKTLGVRVDTLSQVADNNAWREGT